MEEKGLTESTMETEMNETIEVQTASVQETDTVIPAVPKKEASLEVILQYREYEVNMDAVTERVKAHYYAKGHPQDSIEDMQIYVKPEDFTAYYVINDGVVGKVSLF